MAIYTYKVLREEAEDNPVALFEAIGEFRAKDPGSAALSAAEAVGKPGTYIAIPERHFNETPIVPTVGFAIAEPDADPPPAPDPPEGGLDPRLDPEHACETVEDGEPCGHLPGDHGAKGLGICRVEGCPCGKYEPAP